ncbi:glycosyltransferase family 4 protein [Bacillus songklensis]|uniref:Glycosyltransferase family 4 protein n=1 Tax=Bacillus songklensis TaxID=1069116 RepID=A0ABV8B1V9_9BACI
MKKILQVCAIDVSVDTLLGPLIQALMNEQYTVHVACTDTGHFKKLQDQGFHMIEVPIDRKISPLSNIKSIIKLYALMKKEQYDIVHVHTPVAAALGRMAAKMAGVKQIVYTAHGFYFHDGMPRVQYRFFYELERFLAKHFTDYLLLQSKEDYELCLEKSFKETSRICHIGNGVDVYSRFHPNKVAAAKEKLRQELGIADDDIVICFIGRLVREKGIFELIESFRLLKEKHQQTKLLVIGDLSLSERDQTSYKELQKLMKDEKVIATGFRKDIPELLSISDIFVLPSYREGLPRSILEAMSMGKPIIATNIRGCREEVVDGENGFLVEKEDHFQLSEKLELLIKNEKIREQLGINSRRMAEKEFNEENVIKKQLQIFHHLLNLQLEGKRGEDD